MARHLKAFELFGMEQHRTCAQRHGMLHAGPHGLLRDAIAGCLLQPSWLHMRCAACIQPPCPIAHPLSVLQCGIHAEVCGAARQVTPHCSDGVKPRHVLGATPRFLDLALRSNPFATLPFVHCLTLMSLVSYLSNE